MHISKLRPILALLEIQIGAPRDDGWMYGKCPFAPFGGHKSKGDLRAQGNKFHVKADNKKRSGFNCYVCGRSGSIVDLATMLGGYRRLDYISLVHDIMLAESEVVQNFEFGEFTQVERPEPISPGQIKGMYKPAWEVPEARQYLKERLISESTATMLGLCYSGTLGQDVISHKRIMFPVKNRKGELFGFSGRSIRHDSKVKIQDMLGLHKEFNLLGADLIPSETKKPILLVEGLFAYASMYEVGADRFGHPIATLGARLSQWQAETLVDWGLPVYAFYDNDEAGKKGINGYTTESGRRVKGVVDLLKGHPLFIPPWPVNAESNEPLTDPDQLESATISQMMEHSIMAN